MAKNVTALGRLQVKPQSVWGTAESSGLLELEAAPVLLNTSREVYERETLRHGFYAHRPLDGPQAGREFAISVPDLHGVSASVPVAAPTPHAEAALFHSLLGGQSTPAGYAASAVVAAGSTASAVKIAFATPSATYQPGDAVVFSDGGSPAAYAIGWVKKVTSGADPDPHTVELFQALPFVPGDGTDTWGSVTSYMSIADPTFLTVVAQSSDEYSRMIAEGCVVTKCSMSLDPAGRVGGEFTLQHHALTAANAALSSYTYAQPRIPPAYGANGARFVLGGSAVAVNSMSIEIMQTVQPLRDHNANQGVGGWLASSRMVTVEVTRLVDGAAPVLAIPPSTSIVVQFGTTPGNMMGIMLPVADLQEVGELSDVGGFIGQKFTYRMNYYAGDTGSGAANSSARVAFA